MGRLSWILLVRLKCNHKCPYKREADGTFLEAGEETHRRKGIGKMKTGRGRVCSFSPRASGRNTVLTPSFQPVMVGLKVWPPENCKRTNVDVLRHWIGGDLSNSLRKLTRYQNSICQRPIRQQRALSGWLRKRAKQRERVAAQGGWS